MPEVSRLARTIARWERELLAHFSTGASNGIIEALNALVKKIKPIGRGFRNIENRPRVLLYCGGVNGILHQPRSFGPGVPIGGESHFGSAPAVPTMARTIRSMASGIGTL